MKADEVTDELIRKLKTGRFRSVRVNYANGDMVGHTGRFEAAVRAVEAVDQALGRLLPVVDALEGAAIIIADHGNAEEMYELDKGTGRPVPAANGGFKSKTSHTLNPVPCILYGDSLKDRVRLRDDKTFGLGNLAATNVNLLGFEAPEIWDESLLELR
jgi:2,3-bisphosphoglycerate-independent phosphoglycerate mutase